MATVYMTFQAGQTAMNKSFTGVVEAAGKDHIILSDPNTGHRYILLMVYVDYIEFPEEINYYYPIDNTLNIVDPDLLEKISRPCGRLQLCKTTTRTTIATIKTATAATTNDSR